MNAYMLSGEEGWKGGGQFQKRIHPSSVLFCSISLTAPHAHQHSPPSAHSSAWVMACVDFLSLWEVVLLGSPLSSCFHACPFNRLGNPSWYLYRPWFSWYRRTSLHFSSSAISPPLSTSSPSPLLSVPSLIMCSSSHVSIHCDSSRHHISPLK